MKGEPNVIARLRQVARTAVFIPPPVIAEIAYGTDTSPRTAAGRAARHLRGLNELGEVSLELLPAVIIASSFMRPWQFGHSSTSMSQSRVCTLRVRQRNLW
jgi:hypothetical protein